MGDGCRRTAAPYVVTERMEPVYRAEASKLVTETARDAEEAKRKAKDIEFASSRTPSPVPQGADDYAHRFQDGELPRRACPTSSAA